MQDNIGIVIAMILIVSLIIIFPLYNLFERQDDMSYTLALKATTNFVDKVKKAGYIDQDMYDDFARELAATGMPYDIELEAHRRILVKDEEINSEYFEQYRIDYNEDIFKVISNETTNTEKLLLKSAYVLNSEDQIYVKLKNSSQTPAQIVFNAIIPTQSKDKIVVNYGGIVNNESWNKVDYIARAFSTSPTTPVVTTENAEKQTGNLFTVESNLPIMFTAKSEPSDWWKKIVSYTFELEYTNGVKETVKVNADSSGVASITKEFDNVINNKLHKLSVYSTDNYGENSERKVIEIKTINILPSKPFLTSNPSTSNNNIIVINSGSNNIEFTAVSTTKSKNKKIEKYIYQFNINGVTQPEQVSTNGKINRIFTQGTFTVTVYAVDNYGGKSPKTTATYQLKQKVIDSLEIIDRGNGRFDIVGKDNKTDIQTTFSNSGYTSTYWVNGKLYTGATANQTNDGIEFKRSVKYDGYNVIISYTATNKSSTNKTVNISLDSDIMIYGNDRATVTSDGEGFTMMNGKYQFYFRLKNSPGVTNVDTFWYGHYGNRANNRLNQISPLAPLHNTDSGMAFSWKNRVIKPGETKTFTVIMGLV